MSDNPIADYALLSDCQSAALISSEGSVDWLCFPRYDSPSVFGRLLGELAGSWSIHPVEPAASSRRYLGRTLVLETTHRTDTGVLTVTDALAFGAEDRGHGLGANTPGALLRSMVCSEGAVDVEIVFAPRPEYGLVHPLLKAIPSGLLARGGADVLALSTPVRLVVDGATARARLSLKSGDVVGFALHHQLSSHDPPPVWSQTDIARRLTETMGAWTSWSQLHQTYQGPWQNLVDVSGRVLQGLTYSRTGAIVAAPTTSLPEATGGTRNWDYRYTWVRREHPPSSFLAPHCPWPLRERL